MRRLGILFFLCAALGIVVRTGGASSMAATTAGPAPGAAPATAAPPVGWNPTALRTAEDLARRVAASSTGCSEYSPWSFDVLADDLKQRGLPVPTAVSQCFAADREDLTFEVFVDEQHKEQFAAAKLALLCKAAATAKMEFAFTYVDGRSWMIEPDHKETADELARLLGATSRQRPCS